MSTPSEEPKRTPESKQAPSSSANTTPAAAAVPNAHPATNGHTSPNGDANDIPLQPTANGNGNGNGNGLANERSSLVAALGQNQDRGSDAQAISAALASTEGSIEKRGSKDRSNAIDKQMEDDQRKFKKECKILLLGEFVDRFKGDWTDG